MSRLCPPARAADRSQVPERWGLASRAGPLALPVQPEMSRTSNNETSDPEEPRYRATPGSDRSLRRASERAGARAGRGLGAGAQRLRIPVARQQADRRRALRGAEELGSERDAADARSHRPGAPERKELGRSLPDHEVTGADRRRDARAGPLPPHARLGGSDRGWPLRPAISTRWGCGSRARSSG